MRIDISKGLLVTCSCLILSTSITHSFQTTSSLTTLTKNQLRIENDITFLYFSNDSSDVTNDEPKLSKQEQILQEVLNIQPETSKEKSDRIERKKSQEVQQKQSKTNNLLIALLSFTAAIGNYMYQYTHPVTDVQLLFSMSQNSCPLTEIGHNGKPTVVDFWAPWCENCKRSAPTLAAIEKEYGDSVNFVMVNGDEAKNWELIERFRVDAIPHLALINKEGLVETALIGPIPRSVLRADLDFLVNENPTSANDDMKADEDTKQTERYIKRDVLPYVMFDAFSGNEDMRKVNF